MDIYSPVERSKRMSLIRNKDTKPEIFVRRLIHKMGYRYRLHRAELPGKPDIVFTSRRKVIFVHGCFWHLHGCKLCRTPKSRGDYWGPKLQGNRVRDQQNCMRLEKAGWDVMILWECELRDIGQLVHRIRTFLDVNKSKASD